MLDEIGVNIAVHAQVAPAGARLHSSVSCLSAEIQSPSRRSTMQGFQVVSIGEKKYAKETPELLVLAFDFSVIIISAFTKTLHYLADYVDIRVKVGHSGRLHSLAQVVTGDVGNHDRSTAMSATVLSPRAPASPQVRVTKADKRLPWSYENDVESCQSKLGDFSMTEHDHNNVTNLFEPVPISATAEIQYDVRIPLNIFIEDLPDESPLRFSFNADGELVKKVPTNLPDVVDRRIASKTALSRAQSGASALGDWEIPSKTKTGKIVDKPVTFHSSAKSSGYGQHPTNPLDVLHRKRQQKLKKAEETRREVRSNSAPSVAVGARLRQYPMDCNCPTQHQVQHDVSLGSSSHSTPIRSLCFSSDGTGLAALTTDSILTTIKLPSAQHHGAGCSYRGHNGPITNASFSHDKRLLLTSSSDGTARVWLRGKEESSALIFSHTKHAVSDPEFAVGSNTLAMGLKLSKSNEQRNKPFGQSILNSSFFFQDRFITLVRSVVVV